MSSFDDVEINNCSWKAHSDDYYRGYEAGAQSRQAEIEQSYKSGFYDGRNGTPCEVVNLQNEIDELNKRIDCYEKLVVSIRNEFDLWSGSGELEQHINAQIEILESIKGSQS